MDLEAMESTQMLFSQVMRLLFSCQFACLGDCGVHPGQVPLLMALSQSDGMSLRQLGDALFVKPPTVTVMIRRMESAGLVQRRRDSEDQRVVRIALTAKGEAAAARVREGMEQLETVAFTHFSPEEGLLFRRLLLQIKQNLMEKLEEKKDASPEH